MLYWLDGRFPRLHSRPVMLLAALTMLWPAACAEPEPSAAASDSNGAARPDGRPAPDLLNRVTNAYPAWSPDGQQVAYMSTADGDFDIYVVSPATGGRAKLTDTEAREGTPVWSPDGSRIAFQSLRDGHSQIYVMNSDGSEQRNLSNNTWHDEHPYWSADGERLLFASDRGASDEAPDNIDIFEMRIDGSGVRQITSTAEVETYPSWSPDESRIAVRRIMPDGNWEVVVLEADGSNPLVVAPHPAFDGWPVWSPAGRRIVFSSERAGSADLWLFDLQTEALRRLTWDDEADERQPWFSPDGRRLAYARYQWFPDQPFYEASEIMLIEVPGGAGPQPSARAHHRLVSGPDGEVLLIGGSTRADDGYTWFDDIWSWHPDSDRWIPANPLPFTRSSHSLAYDRSRGEVVLIGGIGGAGDAARGTVWARSDGAWEMRDEVTGDGWAEPAACYDRARERVVIFGGWNRDNEFRGDTWEWDGERLVRASGGKSAANDGPPGRAGHEMAYDPVRGRCIMFGGRGNGGFLPGTWAWDGKAWERIASGAEGPPPRWFFGMATADVWNRVVVFGGASGDGDLGDTWLWDGAAWKPVAGRAPPARGMSRIAFDGEHVVLFGGRQAQPGSPPFTDLADTWLFDGEQWSAVSPEAASPTASDE